LDRDEIWQDFSSTKYPSIDGVGFSFESYFQDGGYDVISRRKVLPKMNTKCLPPVQQHAPVPDL